MVPPSTFLLWMTVGKKWLICLLLGNVTPKVWVLFGSGDTPTSSGGSILWNWFGGAVHDISVRLAQANELYPKKGFSQPRRLFLVPDFNSSPLFQKQSRDSKCDSKDADNTIMIEVGYKVKQSHTHPRKVLCKFTGMPKNETYLTVNCQS